MSKTVPSLPDDPAILKTMIAALEAENGQLQEDADRMAQAQSGLLPERWYNTEHLHSAIRFVTPNMRHTGQDRDALEKRANLYANARAAKPERWSGKARNWQPAGPVWLNPERENSALEIRVAA